MLQLALSGVGAHTRTVSMHSVGTLTTSSPVIRNLAHIAPACNAFASFQRAMIDSSFQPSFVFTATVIRSCPTETPSCRNETTSPCEQEPLLQLMPEHTRISAAGTPGYISPQWDQHQPRWNRCIACPHERQVKLPDLVARDLLNGRHVPPR